MILPFSFNVGVASFIASFRINNPPMNNLHMLGVV